VGYLIWQLETGGFEEVERGTG